MLNSITIPTSVTLIEEDAFLNCHNLTSIVIPESVKEIKGYAFCNCNSLKEIKLPTNLTEISDGLFQNCISLKSIEIPDNVKMIGAVAFLRCDSLRDIKANYIEEIGDASFAKCKSLQEFVIPGTVKTIGREAFSSCALTKVIIPKSTTKISRNPFYNCNNLDIISVESGNPIYDSRDNCNAIIESATNKLVSTCKNSTIPVTIVTLGENSFYSLNHITEFKVPTNITTIENGAFENCKNLTSIFIPKSVTKIGTRILSGCNNLKNIVVESGNPVYDSRDNSNAIIETETNTLISTCTDSKIPETVVAIGDFAFFNSNVKSITLHSGIKAIGRQAFSHCSNLTSIISHIPAKSVPQLEENTFNMSNTGKCTLYIPHGTTGTYKSLPVWRTFENTVEM